MHALASECRQRARPRTKRPFATCCSRRSASAVFPLRALSVRGARRDARGGHGAREKNSERDDGRRVADAGGVRSRRVPNAPSTSCRVAPIGNTWGSVTAGIGASGSTSGRSFFRENVPRRLHLGLSGLRRAPGKAGRIQTLKVEQANFPSSFVLEFDPERSEGRRTLETWKAESGAPIP